ncbi:twitching motility protein PilT [Neosynechococcus sphagnicola sy1]|uniref:Twitching motility protein PilT n=1 Tax=Neosynechococcus sphagnicola sy1 TaxID=1497020 RepID=A0A098TNC7_9CYAN|nr:twitching motility protein PilT [Neosynechococcus sphagnicola sy1]
MRIDEALVGVSRLFLDTAPVIYQVERIPHFMDVIDPIFDRLDRDITSVISPVTLAECLGAAIRLNLVTLEQTYLNLLDRKDVIFVETTLAIARETARIRFKYNFLQLADALQVATALQSGCEAFLTNNAQLKQVKELRMLVVKEMQV